MSDSENEKLATGDTGLFPVPGMPADASPIASNRPSPFIWLGLGALAVVALAVVFVLPGVVERYELPLERRLPAGQIPLALEEAPLAVINAVSPFSEAQRSIQRKDAQDVLAELLRVQAELDESEVQSWAAEEYAGALAFASQGDAAYLQQDFLAAAEQYSQALEQLARLMERVPAVLEDYLQAGDSALANADSAGAEESFSIALRLDPDDPRAQVGLRRAQSLDAVSSRIAQAEELAQNGSLEQARALYREALELDDESDVARQSLRDIEARILERQFSQIMSEGFGLLRNDDPETAIEAFQRAAALGINPQQAQAAIQQTRDEVARVEIERLGLAADQARGSEDWQQAVTAYDGVLQIDANLVFAQQGLDYASKRLLLDQLLDAAIANPERFAEDAVYAETLDIYYTGRAIEGPGPRLESQLARLQVLLENSQIPVTVNFVSDSLTQVTILRIADLGLFEAQSLALKPGRYVATGTRRGYRDVREEFVVGFGQTPESVVVKCDERVTTVGGR